MFAIGDGELGEPAGDTITCLFCKKEHPIEFGTTTNANGEPEVCKKLGFYKCGDKAYLASVNGRLIRQ